MKEKELDICIWLHHTATFLGIFCGMSVLIRKKLGKCRICILVLFIESQLWGAVKIVRDLRNRRSRLRDSLERIQACSKSRRKEMGIIAGLICGSILFKLGIPWAAGRKES